MGREEIPFAAFHLKYDRNQLKDQLEDAEKLRQGIASRFPKASWGAMKLEDYALGNDNFKSTYSYLIEFGSVLLGSIRGNRARKFGIYYKPKELEWYYDAGRFKSVDDAWQDLRGGFVEMFAAADEKRWDSIDEISALYPFPMVRLKTLYIYYPDAVLPIYSRDHLLYFLNHLARPEGNEKTYDVVHLNRVLLASLREDHGLRDWSTIELMRLLYAWSDPREQKQIIKIAPGHDAMFWSECLAEGYVCVGWDEVGDLRNYASKDEFKSAFAREFSAGYKNDQKTVSRKGNELWRLTEIEPGDIIVANREISQILAIGEVLEPAYEWLETRQEFKHIIRVKWDTSYAQQIPPVKRWGLVTVDSVKPDLYAIIMKKENPLQPPVIVPAGIPVERIYAEMEQMLLRKKQVILYGPPGTGKTYIALRFAVWWLAKNYGDPNANVILTDEIEFKRAEQKLRAYGVEQRFWWVVANPKTWTWDNLFRDKTVDYDYGRLRKNFPLVQKGDVVFGYEANPVKSIVAMARVTRGLERNSAGDRTITLEPLVKLKEGVPWDELKNDPLIQKSEPLMFNSQGTLFSISQEEALQLMKLISEKNSDFELDVEDSAVLGPLTRLTFHASYSYEDFIEGFRPVKGQRDQIALRLEDGVFKRLCRKASSSELPYLVFIDEINRANVTRVLGETITLLEADKRGHTITLPQSKDLFSIPPNVYTIGTMNTADRSIKLVDVALRRRFAFIEMMPDCEMLEGIVVGGLPLDKFLSELNRRITVREGREKQIGHSFLLENGNPVSSAGEFCKRFRYEILPLLQEYCYDNYDALADILGNKLIDRDNQSINQELLESEEELIDALKKEMLGLQEHNESAK